MGFMALGGDFQVSENISPWMDRKRSDFPSLTGTYITNWDTAFVHMSVAEESIIKETGRFNTPVECWGWTKSPIYHADRFHTYINCPNKIDPDVAEREKQSIQEYYQRTLMKVGIRGDQDIQGRCGQTSSMAVRSMFAERRIQISQYWKEEIFGSLEHVLLMYEIMDPYTSRSVRLACAGSLKGKYER